MEREKNAMADHVRAFIWQYLREFRPALAGLWATAFLGGILCARCRFLDSFMPAGLAWAAAWGTLGAAYVPASLGVLLVFVIGGNGGMIGAMLLMSLLLTLRSVVPWLEERKWTGCAALILSHLPALLLRQLPLEALMDLWNLTLSAALYIAFLRTGEWIRRGCGQVNAEISLCLALSLGSLLAGIPMEQGGIADAAGFACMLIVLFSARLTGASGGASAGLAAGLVCCLAGHRDAAFVCILGGSGLAAGACRGLGIPGVCLGFFLAQVSLSLLLTGSPFSAVSWQAVLAALGVCLIFPTGFWKKVSLRLLPAPESDTALAPDARQAGVRLKRFADCFSELAGLLGEGEEREEPPWEDAMPVLEQVAQSSCVDCPKRELCWKREFSHTAADLLSAARVQEEEKRILWEEDFPSAFAERCPRLPYVTQALRRASGQLTMRTQIRDELKRSRELVGQQLTGVSRVMEQLSREMQWSQAETGQEASILRTRLKARQIGVRAVSVTKDTAGRYRVRMVLESCRGEHSCLQEILPILSGTLGCSMQWQPTACGGNGQKCRLTFVQARLLSLTSSALQWAAEDVCGDACLRLSLGNRGYLLALSDGMGIGEAAARESQRLLKLVEEFYRAGFEEEVIFKTINEMLLLRPGREKYATLDVCLVDLVHARAHFVKLGAAPSYIVRDGQALPVVSSSLPMGIVEEMRPFAKSVDLLVGDVIVMGSDGMMTQEEDFGDRLTRRTNLAPERMARSLMKETLEREDIRSDDRTLLVARISGTRQDRAEEFRQRRMMKWKARVS